MAKDRNVGFRTQIVVSYDSARWRAFPSVQRPCYVASKLQVRTASPEYTTATARSRPHGAPKVVDVKHGRSKIARLLPLFLLLLPAGSLAQNIDVVFHWAPSPLEDDNGHLYSPAVEYIVYHQRDGGQIQLVKTVTDTIASVSLEPGFTHRIRVCGVDALQRTGLLSEWSDDLYIDPDIPQSGDEVPLIPRLKPSYPNPFNPETTITYGVPEAVGAALGALAHAAYHLGAVRQKLAFLAAEARP